MSGDPHHIKSWLGTHQVPIDIRPGPSAITALSSDPRLATRSFSPRPRPNAAAIASRRGPSQRASKQEIVLPARYESALRTTVATSAGPYGYTLTIWTSGAVLSHARGIPSSVEALLFLIGAVAAYALVGSLAFGGFSKELSSERARSAVWGGLHLISVSVAIGVASLVAHFLRNNAAWPLGGFLATAIYLLASAVELAAAQVPHQPRPGAGMNATPR